MILDLWSFIIILSDILEYLNLWLHTGELFSITTFLTLIGFGLISFLVWKSTDTPDNIPNPPPPPFVISIQIPNGAQERQSLRDVRLLSSGPYLSRLFNNNSQNQASNTNTTPPRTETSVGTNPNPQQTPSPRIPLLHRLLFAQRIGVPGRITPRSIFRRFHNFRSRIYSPVPPLFLYQRFYSPRRPTTSNEQNSPTNHIPISDLTLTPEEFPVLTANSNPIPADNRFSISEHLNLEEGGGSLVVEEESLDEESPKSEESLTMSTQNEPINPESSVPQSGDGVKFIIKFLNDTQIDVTTVGDEKVGDFKKRHFSQELNENKIVRLIYGGRVLDNDHKTLKEYGITDQCVVHCLVITPQQRQNPRGDSRTTTNSTSGTGNNSTHHGSTNHSNSSTGRGNRNAGPEPGLFFVSLMGVILLFLWFICFNFGQQLFTQSAVVSLSVLTAIFIVGLVAFYLPVHPTPNVNAN